MRLLRDAGYAGARDFAGGLDEWRERGGALVTPAPSAAPAQRRGPVARLLEWLETTSAGGLARLGLALVVGCALLYWALGALDGQGIRDARGPLGADGPGLLTALYYSVATATTLGYGDVTPLGVARAVAVFESIAGLLLFGALIAKFLSRRQEALMRDLHELSFEERLARVQASMHRVIGDLTQLADTCERNAADPARIAPRLASTVLLFVSGLRSIHDLLHRPLSAPSEETLASILASLETALSELIALLACPTARTARGAEVDIQLARAAHLATQICSECIPGEHAPRLASAMNRVQARAAHLG